MHKQANVLTALRKSAHPGALAATRDIYHAEDIDKAQVAIRAFELDYGAKYPKAVAKITDDADVLLEFYKYQRSRGTKRRNCHGLQADRRRTGPLAGRQRTPPLGAGATFHKGKLLERPIDITPAMSDAEPENAGSEVA